MPSFKPRDYQQLIIEHQLSTPRCGTLVFMGAGKTVSTLTTIRDRQLIDMGQALVIAPKRVALTTWPNECRKWAHLSGMEARPVIGTPAERRAALRDSNAAVLTINYENIQWLREELGSRWPFDMVVCDESTRLKGFRLRKGSKRARLLAQIAHESRYWINLTGTPAPNGLIDLWGQQWFIDFGEALGKTFTAYQSRWFMPDNPMSDFPRYVPRPFADQEIHERLKPTNISLKAEDWFDIEKPIFKDIFVELPDAARKHYERLERDMYTQIEGADIEALNTGVLTEKCGQLANGALYTEDGEWKEVHDVKLQALESLANEMDGEPLLVAYNYRSDLERLRKAFPRARVLDDNPKTERDWNAGKINMLLAHPASAGHGLNLQDGGRILVFFGMGWNGEYYDQIIERIGPVRQAQSGHPRAVFVYRIVAKDTVDQLKIVRAETKQKVQNILLDALRKYRA